MRPCPFDGSLWRTLSALTGPIFHHWIDNAVDRVDAFPYLLRSGRWLAATRFRREIEREILGQHRKGEIVRSVCQFLRSGHHEGNRSREKSVGLHGRA